MHGWVDGWGWDGLGWVGLDGSTSNKTLSYCLKRLSTVKIVGFNLKLSFHLQYTCAGHLSWWNTAAQNGSRQSKLAKLSCFLGMFALEQRPLFTCVIYMLCLNQVKQSNNSESWFESRYCLGTWNMRKLLVTRVFFTSFLSGSRTVDC